MIKFVAILVLLEGRSQCFGQFLFSVIEFFFLILHKNRFKKFDAKLLFCWGRPAKRHSTGFVGRFDNYFFPFYKTLSTAQEMLRIAWLDMYQTIWKQRGDISQGNS